MKKIILNGMLLILLSGCVKETEIVRLELAAKIEGTIVTYDEFNNLINDPENVQVQLEGTDPVLSTFTDKDGKYEFENVPTGTYNLIFSKEGYGTSQEQGIKIVGGSEAVRHFYNDLFAISTITIENLTVENVDNQTILLKAIVNHDFTNTYPVLLYYLHTSENTSGTHYMQFGYIYFFGASGTQLSSTIEINSNKFSPGSTIYAVAYGSQSTHASYYDIQTGLLIFPSLGEASNTASVTIP